MKPTSHIEEPTDVSATQSRLTASRTAIWWAIAVALLIFILVTAEKHGPASSENRNPAGIGKPPPVAPLLAPFDWVMWGQILGALLYASIMNAQDQ